MASVSPTQELPMDRSIEVVPPPDNVFLTYARAVCEHRARTEGDPRLLDPEIAHGLANFLKLMAVLEARRINRERNASVDLLASKR